MNSPAQRLWVLERHHGWSRMGAEDVCCFLGAVAVLAAGSTYVTLVRSPELDRASETSLRDVKVRFAMERDAIRFSTLDDAMAWGEQAKQEWMCRGWTEVLTDFEDR